MIFWESVLVAVVVEVAGSVEEVMGDAVVSVVVVVARVSSVLVAMLVMVQRPPVESIC